MRGRAQSPRGRRVHVWQERREQANGRQECAQPADRFNADRVRRVARRRGAKATHPEREAEQDAGDEPDAARHQFLRVDDDGRECRCQREREHVKNGAPDDVLAPEVGALSPEGLARGSEPHLRLAGQQLVRPAGRRSTRACTRITFPIPRPRSATASTTWRNTTHARTSCSCRSTGTSCAATMPGSTG